MSPDSQPSKAYYPVDLNSLQIDSALDFNLYLEQEPGAHRLFRGRDLQFTDRQRARLVDNRVEVLYITEEERAAYARYVERHLGPMLADDRVSLEKKTELLYSVKRNVLSDAFANPREPEVVRRSQHVATETVGLLLKGPTVLNHMVMMMSDDYDTFEHSINVSVLSVSLAAYVGVAPRHALDDLAAGTLLHDIGKSEIPRDLLKRTGPLSPHEMEVIKSHVELGEAILSLNDQFTSTQLIPVSQHHEKLNGEGYPRGLRDADIHLFGRLAAVADCFDAMTSHRTYQKALKAFDALTLMKGRLREMYDQELVDSFIAMLARAQTSVRRAS